MPKRKELKTTYKINPDGTEVEVEKFILHRRNSLGGPIYPGKELYHVYFGYSGNSENIEPAGLTLSRARKLFERLNSFNDFREVKEKKEAKTRQYRIDSDLD